MRFILTTLIAIFLAFTAAAQSPIFEFECFSNANMTGDSCDICVGTSFQSRSFNGLMVYRLGVFNRWIDEPYLIRLRPGNSVEFIEQIGTNPDRITIPLNQTGFSTISGFIDSTFCAGANVDFSFFASDSLRTTAINYLDTIKIVGRGGTTVFFDTLTQKYIITSPASSGGTNLSFTGSNSPVTLNSSTGTDVNFAAGASISLAGTSTNLTITNTAPNINQTISTTGTAGNITLSNGGGTLNLNVNDADANPTNEIQTLSYSAPNLSLSGGGGSVAIPQGTVTGTGTGDQVTFFSGTSSITGSSRFTVNNSSLAGLIINGGDGAGGNGSYIQFRKDGTNNFIFGAESSLFGGNGTGGAIFQYGNNPFFFCTNSSKRAVLLGNGNFGIGTLNPSRLFHVEGAARITGSAGTGTSVMLRDASGDISNATLGAGLSITSGTLSASGTVGGTGIANKVAYWSGTNTLTATANFAFDGTNLAVGTPTAGAGRLRVVGNSTSVSLQVDAGTLPNFGSQIQSTATTASGNSILGLDFTGTTTGSTTNYLHKLENNGTGSTILQLNSASGGGSPFVQYNIVGGSANWTHGVDNADSRKFKIRPNADWSGTTGLTITTGGLVGIANSSPAASLDMDNTTDGIALSSGNTANRPTSGLRWFRYNSSMAGLETRTISSNWHVLNSANSVTLGAGGALGTAPTITVNNGTEMAYTVSLTVGTAPVANAVIFTRTFPSAWSVAPTIVFSAANQVTASEITKFYVDTQTTGQYTIRANGTLSTPQTYKLNVIVRN